LALFAGFKAKEDKMNVTQKNELEDAINKGYHVLSVAETGFNKMPLIIMGKQCNVTEEEMKRFLEQVNTNDESGSLHPVAPISAIPKKYFWDEGENIQALASQIEGFLQANQSTIKATKLLFDFRWSMKPFVIEACELALKSQYTDNVDEVVIINHH